MTERAAIHGATYCDLRFIKGRKQTQIVLEIPTEQTDSFVRAFGTPNPADPLWVVVARPSEQQIQNTAKQFSSLPPKSQIYARCKEPKFQSFIGCLSETDAKKKLEADFSLSARFPMPEEKIEAWKKMNTNYEASLS